jgi:hypothetical protein
MPVAESEEAARTSQKYLNALKLLEANFRKKYL